MKRKRSREHDEAIAREQAEHRRDALLAALKARQGLPEPAPEPEPEPEAAGVTETEAEAAEPSVEGVQPSE